MIKAGSKFTYKVKYVSHKNLSDKTITTFSIGDKVKNGNGQYKNYSCTVWGYVEMKDGDEVCIEEIIDLSSYQHTNGKIYDQMSVRASVIEKETQEFETEAPAPYTKKYESPNPEGFFQADDSELELPFDL